MSPEQLKKLQRLSQLFQDGLAGPDQIKQLSELLAIINHHAEPAKNDEVNVFANVIPSR